MGAPKGNTNGHGAKGRSGRKSHYQELADALKANEIFFNEFSKADTLNDLKKDHISVYKVYRSKLLSGNERLIAQLVNKVFPDKHEITGQDGGAIKIKIEDAAELLGNAIIIDPDKEKPTLNEQFQHKTEQKTG
jgi:hypothetical protein